MGWRGRGAHGERRSGSASTREPASATCLADDGLEQDDKELYLDTDDELDDELEEDDELDVDEIELEELVEVEVVLVDVSEVLVLEFGRRPVNPESGLSPPPSFPLF